MKKRITAIIMAMLCLLLTACSGTQSGGTANDVSDSNAVVRDERYIELSGDENDSFVAEEDCYTEGDDVVMFFQKGVTVTGDMLAVTERVMSDLCETTGLTFDKNHDPESYMDCLGMYFENGKFADINSDMTKVNVIIANLEDTLQYASDNNAILESADYDYEQTYYQTIYHELTHVIQMRNGVSLGSVMDEGYATYIADKAQRAQKMQAWNTVQYYFPYSYDDSVVSLGENGFKHYFVDDRDANYQYGIRFITFLYDVYGDEMFGKILKEATEKGFDSGYDPEDANTITEDTEELKIIIKSKTDEDVFEKFADWYADNWSVKGAEYVKYMESIGNDMTGF